MSFGRGKRSFFDNELEHLHPRAVPGYEYEDEPEISPELRNQIGQAVSEAVQQGVADASTDGQPVHLTLNVNVVLANASGGGATNNIRIGDGQNVVHNR